MKRGFMAVRVAGSRDVRGAKAPSTAHVCDPPEAFILHREIVLTMKANVTLRADLD